MLDAFRPIADHILYRERLDLGVVVAELVQDLGVVLAEHRGGAVQSLVDARVVERCGHRRLAPDDRVLDLVEEAARDELRVLGECARVDDACGRHTGCTELLDAGGAEDKAFKLCFRYL